MFQLHYGGEGVKKHVGCRHERIDLSGVELAEMSVVVGVN